MISALPRRDFPTHIVHRQEQPARIVHSCQTPPDGPSQTPPVGASFPSSTSRKQTDVRSVAGSRDSRSPLGSLRHCRAGQLALAAIRSIAATKVQRPGRRFGNNLQNEEHDVRHALSSLHLEEKSAPLHVHRRRHRTTGRERGMAVQNRAGSERFYREIHPHSPSENHRGRAGPSPSSETTEPVAWKACSEFETSAL
jgi:hypothetical protein